MTKPIPFTAASLARTIRGIEQAGKFAVGVKPDGTVIVSDKPVDVTSLLSIELEQSPPSGPRFGDKLGWPKSPERRMGDYFEPASKWEDERADEPNMRSFGERPGNQQRRSSPTLESSPLAAAFARWERGEITLDQLPPGRYPNGMRVYADGEWEAIVRNRPLGKRELASLKAYFDADGSPNFRNGGPDTNERLQIRGLIEISDEPPEGSDPFYRITTAGKVEWQRLSTKSD